MAMMKEQHNPVGGSLSNNTNSNHNNNQHNHNHHNNNHIEPTSNYVLATDDENPGTIPTTNVTIPTTNVTILNNAFLNNHHGMFHNNTSNYNYNNNYNNNSNAGPLRPCSSHDGSKMMTRMDSMHSDMTSVKTERDADDLLEDEALDPPSEDPYGLHEQCGLLIRSQAFQTGILLLIVLNSIITALGTFEFVMDNPMLQERLETMDTILLTIFTVELVLHFYYYGLYQFLTKGWLVFDLIIVTTSWAFDALAIFRSFRILRTVRVITRVKEIRELVDALFQVIPRMCAISTLLLLIYFVFAVLFTELFRTTYEDGITSSDYFSRLDTTAFTLLQFMFLDDWSRVTKELMIVYPWAWIPVLAFIIICTFIVVNLIIAVICNAVQSIQTEEMTSQMENLQTNTKKAIYKAHKKDKTEREHLDEKLEQILEILDRQEQRFFSAQQHQHEQQLQYQLQMQQQLQQQQQQQYQHEQQQQQQQGQHEQQQQLQQEQQPLLNNEQTTPHNAQ